MQNAAYYIFSFNPKCFALVRGTRLKEIFHRRYITQKRLRTTGIENKHWRRTQANQVGPTFPVIWKTFGGLKGKYDRK